MGKSRAVAAIWCLEPTRMRTHADNDVADDTESGDASQYKPCWRKVNAA